VSGYVVFNICALHFEIDLMTSVSLGKVYVFSEKSRTWNVWQLLMKLLGGIYMSTEDVANIW